MSSLRPNLRYRIEGRVEVHAIRWREHIETSAEILASFNNGDPALVRNGGVHYLACWPDKSLLAGLVLIAAEQAGLATIDLPDHVRLRWRGSHLFAFNCGGDEWAYPAGVELVLGEASVSSHQLAVWRSPASVEN